MTNKEFGNSSETQHVIGRDTLSDAIDKKFNAHPECVSTYTAITGQIFEVLTLGTAYLRREMLPDGTRGVPNVDYRRKNFSGAMSWNERITLSEHGEWVYVFDNEDLGGHRVGDKVSPFRRGAVLTRVLAGRPKSPDRWADDPSLQENLDRL